MKLVGKVLLVSVLSILIVGCKKDRTREEKVSAMIDKVDSPFFIANVNLQNLMDKSEIMKEGTLPFTYYQVISFFLAVELTGIDYDTDAQIIVGEGKAFLPNFYGIFKVKDEALFTTLLEKEANATIQEKDGMKYAIKESEQYCVVWNEEFAVISNIPLDFASMLTGGGGKEGQKMVDKNIEMINYGEEGEVNADYVTFLTKDADLSMLYNGKGFYSYMSSMAMEDKEEVEKMKDLYEGMSYEFYLNFNNGNIDLEMVADLDDKLKEQLSFIAKDGVSNKMLGYGKSSNPLLVGSYKMSVPGMLDYFKETSEEQYEKMVEDLGKEGLKIEDVKDALSGEIVYMVENVIQKEEVFDFGYDEPITIKNDEPLFAIVLGVSDKSIIEKKIQDVLTGGQNDLATVDGDEVGAEKGPEMELWPNGVINMGDAYLFLKDDALFMSNDSSWANMIASGKGVKVANPDNVVTENPFGIFVDISKMKQYDGANKDAAQYAELFESFKGSANLDGGKFTLNLTNKDENALKVLTVTVGSILADFEKEMNPDMEAELEEAIKETESIEGMPTQQEVEKAVDDAFDKLENELK
ncbi:MAG: hypothetical protein H6582_07870 [Crocinitomicaceae bacterium]|nr:hypothetical protein [Crocinitomicaceae bacterium]